MANGFKSRLMQVEIPEYFTDLKVSEVGSVEIKRKASDVLEIVYYEESPVSGKKFGFTVILDKKPRVAAMSTATFASMSIGKGYNTFEAERVMDNGDFVVRAMEHPYGTVKRPEFEFKLYGDGIEFGEVYFLPFWNKGRLGNLVDRFLR